MTGYWEPHSSSVDFCEQNYFLNPYIAEPHNVWSSLFITFLGVVGLLYGNPMQENSVSAMFFILAVIGMGSAALHATLHWIPQSSDEVPMLWQVMSFLHMLYLIELKEKKQFYSINASYTFIFITVVQTIMYYRFQQTYAIFITSFIIYSGIVVFGSYRTVVNINVSTAKSTLWFLWKWAVLFYVVFGAGLWIIDMNLCDYLVPIYAKFFYGCTLHVLWHIFAGLGSYFVATCMVGVRLHQAKREVKLNWVCGLPICVDNGDQKLH